jgi:hypothetical protein
METTSNDSESAIEIWDSSNPRDIVFHNIDSKWIMCITSFGQIKFNREDFPDLAADEFAEEVIRILEHLFLNFRPVVD